MYLLLNTKLDTEREKEIETTAKKPNINTNQKEKIKSMKMDNVLKIRKVKSMYVRFASPVEWSTDESLNEI